jgi:hypothetical protein
MNSFNAFVKKLFWLPGRAAAESSFSPLDTRVLFNEGEEGARSSEKV